jgi:hypothetical protein
MIFTSAMSSPVKRMAKSQKVIITLVDETFEAAIPTGKRS